MRILADENMHPLVVTQLRQAGLDVDYVRDTAPGMSDEEILARPDIGEMVLITLDRDFGDLIFNRGYPQPRAILYSRLSRALPEAITQRILKIVEIGVPDHHLVTITPDKERLRPFPLGVQNG
ncbi:MAG TPA: DUF5615 family PIN-like protein [Allosphingosinicella sp.]